jgi:hypothetical protein
MLEPRDGSVQYFSVALAGDGAKGDEQQAVMVPGYAGTLAPRDAARLRGLRKHLVEAMRDAREAKTQAAVTPPPPQPQGFRASVARAACTLCRGWCCRNGGEHAYLDGRALARVRRERPDLDARAILRLYSESVAEPAYAGSCMFHGASGCTLDRSLRSDLCNSYYCAGLEAFMKSETLPDSAMVLSAAEGKMRMSPVLTRSVGDEGAS